jgi:hypothetical protein
MDGKLLAQYVLATIDADPDRLAETIANAREAHDSQIDVLALDSPCLPTGPAGDDTAPERHQTTRPSMPEPSAKTGRPSSRVVTNSKEPSAPTRKPSRVPARVFCT